MGRVKVWITPQSLWDDFIEYAESRKAYKISALDKQKEFVEIDRPLPITIEGFCTFKGISRQSFYRYREYEAEEKGEKDEKNNNSYSDTIARIEQYIEAYTNEQAAIGNFEGRWYELYAKNKFGYSDRQEVVNDTQINIAFSIPRPALDQGETIPTVDITPKLGKKSAKSKSKKP